ncbi:transketolase [Candidatus Uhrbacteria bacterium]|nr:transketolase [Candidatus Uhrbacteria bacterium]
MAGGKKTNLSLKQLALKANEIRRDIIKALFQAGSGHSAGPLGMADVLTALYFRILHIDPKNPLLADRDRVVLSNAHICPVLYATLAHRGFCSVEDFVHTLRTLDSPFQGHSNNHRQIGIETCGGPLGQGLSQAIGMALAARSDQRTWRTYCLMSDGELDEGQTWEAIMFAGKERLHNLTAIIDRNNIQIDGYTESIMPLEPLAEKWEAFNWHVIEIDGHNMRHIIDAVHEARAVYEKPTVIIAHTIPGKGVSFMENRFEWHGKPPNEKEAQIALHELRTLAGRIRSEHE